MSANGDAGGFVVVLLMLFLGLPALLVVLAALLPGYAGRAQGLFRARPARSFLLGLLEALVLLGLAWLCMQVPWPPLQALGAFFLLVVLPVGLVLGVLVAAGLVGEAVWQQLAGRHLARLAAVVVGCLLLTLAASVPIAGWLLVPVLALTGLGAAVTALFQRRAEVVPPAR